METQIWYLFNDNRKLGINIEGYATPVPSCFMLSPKASYILSMHIHRDASLVGGLIYTLYFRSCQSGKLVMLLLVRTFVVRRPDDDVS